MEKLNERPENPSLPLLFHLIYKKGDPYAILDITRDTVKKRFLFMDGIPVGASSNVLNEVFGRLLMSEGIISHKDYENSIETMLREKKRHGEVLISMGKITTETLDKFLCVQLRKRVWNVFNWKAESYSYISCPEPFKAVTPLNMHPAALLLEGINLGFYPLDSLHRDLKPYLGIKLKGAATDKYSVDDFNLKLQERRFYDAFDGDKTVQDILKSTDLLKHRAYSLALSFIITGIVTGADLPQEPVLIETKTKDDATYDGAQDSRLKAELLFMKAKSAIDTGNFKEAAVILREITVLNPKESEYWAYLGWAMYMNEPDKLKDAEHILKDAINLNAELDYAWYFLGTVLSIEEMDKDAIDAFNHAVKKNQWRTDALAEIKRLEIKKHADEDHYASERARYMNYFHFIKDPFALAPASKAVTLIGEQKKALNMLVKSISEKTGVVLIEGERGLGKTTIALELLHAFADKKALCAMLLDPLDKELAIVHAINAEMGVTSASNSIKDELMGLGMRISQNKVNGGYSIIIIDNAHLLNKKCLKLVEYLSRIKMLHIILVGNPVIAKKLKDADFNELNSRIMLHISLDPFTQEETAAYITNKIKAAVKKGERADAVLDETLTADTAIKNIYRASKGVAAAIDLNCIDLLFRKTMEGARPPDNDNAHTGPAIEEKGEAFVNAGASVDTSSDASTEPAFIKGQYDFSSPDITGNAPELTPWPPIEDVKERTAETAAPNQTTPVIKTDVAASETQTEAVNVNDKLKETGKPVEPFSVNTAGHDKPAAKIDYPAGSGGVNPDYRVSKENFQPEFPHHAAGNKTPDRDLKDNATAPLNKGASSKRNIFILIALVVILSLIFIFLWVR